MNDQQPPPSLTERQRHAAEAVGDVAIVAGAGTGKTHTLGHRYLKHLAEGSSPLALVAVTFTERAAHELRARVRRYAAGAFGAEDPRLAELEAATIGTVHALCLRICRDHPDAAGVPPDVRILDPLEGTIWTEERLEAAMERMPAGLFEALPYERARDALRKLLNDPWKAGRALEQGPERWPELVARARERSYAEHLGTALVVEARTRLKALAGPPADAGEQAREAVLAAFAAAASGEPETVRELLHRRRPNVGTARAWGSEQTQLRASLAVALDALRGWASDPLSTFELGLADDTLAEVQRHLRAGFATARDELAAAKRRAGVVDFADVELAALRALEHDEVRGHYARRWTTLLVDEVQDTSPVQEAILAQLASFCRTTLVGDAKQSIYGFRGADAQVFRRMTERVVQAGGTKVVLDRSFRAHRELVACVNAVFERVLASDHEPLDSDAEAPGPAPHLLRWSLTAPTGTPAFVARLAEAHRIADEILARLEAGVAVRDAEAVGGTRPMRPSDVAVLARTWAPLDLLAEVLPARGVAAVHTGGGDLMRTREAQDAMAVLRFLVDPHDDVALVALLRGPGFAISDTELERFAVATSDRRDREAGDSWWRRFAGDPPEWAARPLAILTNLLEDAGRARPSRLLQSFDRETGWSAVVANMPGGPRRSADLQGFLELVRAFERDGGDVFSVTRRLRRIVRAEVEVDRPALDAENAVTLTTVHRAKGLEWPWVILAAIDAGTRKPYLPIRFAADLGVAVRVEAADERNATPALWILLERAQQIAEETELRRLVYVALTRASDLATVSAARSRGPVLALLEDGLEAAGVADEANVVGGDAAKWPEPPLPDPIQCPSGGGAVVTLADGPAPARTDESAWAAVIWRAEALVPEAAAVLARLRESGAPAPQADRIETEEESGQLGAWTLALWHLGGVPLRLIEADAPELDGAGVDSGQAERVVRADPLDPDATYALLAPHLGADTADPAS